MSLYSEPQFDDYEGLDDCDYSPLHGGIDSSGGRSSVAASPSQPLAPASNRSVPSRFSEASMDFGDLQDDLSTCRMLPGSMNSRNKKRPSSVKTSRPSLDLSDLTNSLRMSGTSMGLVSDGSLSLSSWCQQPSPSQNNAGTDGDDTDCGSYGGYLNYGDNTGSSTVHFDEVPQECLSPFLSACTRRNSLPTVDEKGESNSTLSGDSNHSSTGAGRRRRVQFESSCRLEKIREFEKPDYDDFHLLYYTAHELQKMIDGRRAEQDGDKSSCAKISQKPR